MATIQSAQSAQQLNDALRNCLAICLRAPSSLVALWDFLMTLRETKRWTDQDLASLRSRAVHVLREVQRGAER